MRRRAGLKPRKRPAQERSRRTVEAILQATAYILVESGYGSLNTNRIAERAGVNIATLYQYFPSKEAVFAELLRRHVAETRSAALETMRSRRGAGLEATVRASVESAIAVHRTAPALHQIFTEEGARLGVGPVEAPADEELARLRDEWVKDARGTREDAKLAFWIARTAVHAVLHQAIVEKPGLLDRSELADELTRLVTGYLRRPRRSRPVRPGQ